MGGKTSFKNFHLYKILIDQNKFKKNSLLKIIRVESLSRKIACKIFLYVTAALYDKKYVRCTYPKQKHLKIESWKNYHLFKNNSVFNQIPSYYISSTSLGETSRSVRTGELLYSNVKNFRFTSLASMRRLKQQHLQVEIIGNIFIFDS